MYDMQILLQDNVLWSYDHEVKAKGSLVDYAFFASIVHDHKGGITLTDNALIITGDAELEISLGSIEQIYMGFDEIYPNTAVKNMGAFWQPVRLTFNSGPSSDTIYLIIGFDGLFARDKLWFDTLKEMLG